MGTIGLIHSNKAESRNESNTSATAWDVAAGLKFFFGGRGGAGALYLPVSVCQSDKAMQCLGGDSLASVRCSACLDTDESSVGGETVSESHSSHSSVACRFHK